MIPTLFLVSLIVFLFIRLIPGNIVELMVAEMATEGEVWGIEVTEALIRRNLGLDQPVHIQYLRWLGNALRGDFGEGLWNRVSVGQELVRRYPISMELGFMGILIGLIIAIPIGLYAAIRQNTIGDYIGRSFAILCIAVPPFWVATLVWVLPAIWWGWTPPVRLVPFGTDPIGNLKQFLLPALITGMFTSGVTMRMVRTTMLEVLRQDYIRTAWSKGLRERVVITRHALKNALLPVITIIGNQIPVAVGMLVIIEQIFNLPGIGRYLFTAITQRDYPVISGVNLCMCAFVLLVNLVVDLTYAWLDPRVQYK
jgi:peptide/nickel transport system permease protein